MLCAGMAATKAITRMIGEATDSQFQVVRSVSCSWDLPAFGPGRRCSTCGVSDRLFRSSRTTRGDASDKRPGSTLSVRMGIMLTVAGCSTRTLDRRKTIRSGGLCRSSRTMRSGEWAFGLYGRCWKRPDHDRSRLQPASNRRVRRNRIRCIRRSAAERPFKGDPFGTGQRCSSASKLNVSPSNNPRSLIFRCGITSKAMKLKVIYGAANPPPNSLAA